MKVKRSDISGYALKFMPSALQEVIFRDEEFCAAVDFKPSFVNTALGDLKIERTSLLRALRAAVNGAKSAKLRTESGLLQATLGRTPEGGATLTVAKTRFALAGAGPLLKVKKSRLAAVDSLFAGRPLTQKEEAYWREVAGRALTDEEFSRLSMAIAQTPEGFQAELSKPRNISLNDLIPGKPDYYERLIGKWNGEETLQAYIDGSLADHRRWLYEKYRSHGMRRMAYSALMPQLVPHEILKDIGASELERLLDVEDPYSLLYVVKVAQSRAITEPKCIPIGTKALNKLFGDEPSVMARLTVFSAAAVASMVRLRLVFEDGRVPLYWFRLAAFAHAGVVTDAFGSLSDGKDFLKWINNLVGPEYVWNTVVDRREAPRWEPGWIAPDQLYAELVGQACGSIPGAVQQNGPKEWEELLKAQIDKVLVGFVNHPFFPGPMDDFGPITAAPKGGTLVEVEEKLKQAQTIDETTGLVGLSFMSNPGEDVAADVARIVELLRTSAGVCTDKEDRFLDIAARVAANSRSITLADSVINQCIRFAAGSSSEKSLSSLLQTSLLACAAFLDPKVYRLKTGETATRFAYATGTKFAQQLLLVFDCLGRRDPKLIASLGRARAIVETVGLRAI